MESLPDFMDIPTEILGPVTNYHPVIDQRPQLLWDSTVTLSNRCLEDYFLKKKGNADFHGLYGSWKDGNTDFKSH